ncbi:transposase [Planosporangium sp. 12N6]|uniref:transposase n=1 Tax=Planosporangium spinosum TaxID=3402278 RepID=UPI003CF66C41
MRSNAPSRRSRRGGGRHGRRENGSGAARRVDLLRGRGGSDAAPAEGAYLGPPRPYPGGGGARQGLRARIGRRLSVPQTGPAQPPDLPHHRPPGTQERAAQLRRDRLIALLDAAHQQLGGPIVLVWDNLNNHVSVAMRQLITARDWLYVIRLPAYAPDLNPTEGVWSHLKRSIGNLAVYGVDHLQAVVKQRLKRIQYRTDLIDSFVVHTGLTLEPHQP